MSTKFRVGNQIRAREVRYIDHEGKQHGVIDTFEAIRHAEAAGLSLVEVDPNASPPVCKALDYNRFQYEKKKKTKSSSSTGAKRDKEVKINTTTGDNDYQIKIKRAIKFLETGHRVKVTVRFRFRRGQELQETPEIINRILEDLKDHGKAESAPKVDSRQAIVYFLKKK